MSNLESIVTEVIHKFHEVEASGQDAEVIHMDIMELNIQPPVRLEGRKGVFQKVEFEYVLNFLASSNLEEDDPVRYKQSLRLSENGEIMAISDPVEIWS